jgi:hypothetical protein
LGSPVCIRGSWSECIIAPPTCLLWTSLTVRGGNPQYCIFSLAAGSGRRWPGVLIVVPDMHGTHLKLVRRYPSDSKQLNPNQLVLAMCYYCLFRTCSIIIINLFSISYPASTTPLPLASGWYSLVVLTTWACMFRSRGLDRRLPGDRGASV